MELAEHDLAPVGQGDTTGTARDLIRDQRLTRPGKLLGKLLSFR
jgi:hypothetical protein